MSVEQSAHVFSAPDVFISGDSHENTFQLPVPDKLNVFVGDLINPKKVPREGTAKYEAWREGFTHKVDRWTDSANSGETIFLLGNHEAQFLSALVNGHDAANIFLYSQKTGKEKGMATLKALGVSVPRVITKESYGAFVDSVLGNETLRDYANMLLESGRLYTLVNDVYISHTLPVTDSRGRLLPLTEDGKKGMDALDVFEDSLRIVSQGSTNDNFGEACSIIHRLATKEFDLPFEPGKQVLGPLWVREKQREDLLRDRTSIGRLVGELDGQARIRGTRALGSIHGHVHEGGEIIYGRSVDHRGNPKGFIANVDFSKLSDHRKRARLMERGNSFVLFCPPNERGNPGGVVRLGSARLDASGEIFSSNNENVRVRIPHPQLVSAR
jgi:hypothetical protein